MRIQRHRPSFSGFLYRAVRSILQNLAENAEKERRRKLEQDSIQVEYKIKD